MYIAARQLELNAQQIEVSQLYLEAMQQQTREDIALREKELQQKYDEKTWPSSFSRSEIEAIFNQQRHRLLMLVPSPKMAKNLPEDFRDNLESGLRNKLKRFVENYYPLHDPLCPVEFYGKFFDRAVFDADLKKLEHVLAVPTAVIYSDINNREVFFNFQLMGLDNPIAFTCPEWNWRETKRELEKSGLSEEDSLEQIETSLIRLHQILSAFLADWYYLNINPRHVPRFFREDLQEELHVEWVGPCIEVLMDTHKAYLQLLAEEMARLQEEEEAEKGTSFTFETVTVKESGAVLKREQKIAYERWVDLGNNVRLSMVYIPAGEFWMGSKDGEGDSDEHPRHKVKIAKPFYLGKTPITQAQWQAVMGNNPSRFEGANRPVERVSWEDAVEFCKKLSYRT